MQFMKRWAALAIVGFALGCGESAGPDGVSGSYALHAIDGLELPTALPVTSTCEIFLSPLACAETIRLEVRSGSATFDDDGTYSLQTLFRRSQPSGAQTDVTATLRGRSSPPSEAAATVAQSRRSQVWPATISSRDVSPMPICSGSTPPARETLTPPSPWQASTIPTTFSPAAVR